MTASQDALVIKEIISLVVDDPATKQAAKNVGKTALTLTNAINNALLPVAAVNFAFDKAKQYFVDNFSQDLQEKASKIPQENIVEPKASVAGPVLQALAFSHDESSLRDMYLALLATAMDSRVSNLAHPAFVEIIKQLNAEEAALIGTILRVASVPVIQIQRVTKADRSYDVVLRHLVNLTSKTSGLPKENAFLGAMIDNWVRLGLVEVDYQKHIMNEGSYKWVESRPELLQLRNKLNSNEEFIEPQKGVLNRTELGLNFALAIGLEVNQSK